MLTKLIAVCLVAMAAADLTPCQTCCSPGGDCSKASHGTPGMCCGEINGASYCCPNVTPTGAPAKCFACNGSYRCYSGTRPSPNICANDGGVKGRSPQSSYGYRSRGGEDSESFVSMFVVLMCGVVIIVSISACIKAQRRMPLAMQQQQQTIEMPTAKPMVAGQALPAGTPCATAYPAQAACAYPAHPGCYPQQYPAQHYPQAGYSGGNVAMGAGMGFLGGMMVSDMMSHHGGGYGGGGYGGGGDFSGGGGGDFSGGGDFAADM